MAKIQHLKKSNLFYLSTVYVAQIPSIINRAITEKYCSVFCLLKSFKFSIVAATGVAKGGVLGVQTPPEISKILPCAHSWVLRGIFCL